jgi:amino acid adenylation domain-containing protein
MNDSVASSLASGAGPVREAEPCAHQRFAAWAARAPDALAVAGPQESLTYGELESAANRWARELQALGVGRETPVAVLTERSPGGILAVLAILKAGGCFLPLDPAYPDDRLLYTLADSRARLLLTEAQLAAARPALARAGIPLLVLEASDAPGAPGDHWERAAGRSAEPLASETLPEQLAYVIYTSGSTGRPKGVEIPHRGLSNLIDWHLRAYGIGPQDRATRLAGPAFDAAVWEVWPYLAAGASLHLPPAGLELEPSRLARWLAAERITRCFLPTPLCEAVLEEAWPEGAGLRSLLTGGDRLHRGGDPRHPFALWNHYGPTENSVVATWGRVTAEPAAGPPPIGRAIDGVAVQVVDDDLRAVAAGEEGELLVGGAGLARGYRGRPELTAERFVPDPLAPRPGSRLYRTGDRVRERPDGDLDFIGRADFQVKIRGFRVELGEIEAALRALSPVRDAVVLARDDAGAGRRLVGYVVPRGSAEGVDGAEGSKEAGTVEIAEVAGAAKPADSGAALAASLASTLPAYMVPVAWVFLDALPLTPNGKVDRAALPAPSADDERFTPPRDAFEEAVAAAFAEVLGLPRVGAEDDFFALGGHSLTATQVLSRLAARCAVELAPRVLFDHPTVEALAALLRRAPRAPDGDAARRIAPLARPATPTFELPASFAQQRLFVADRYSPERALYNTPFALRLTGPLDPRALAGALQAIADRHETLRTSFRLEETGLLQVVARRLALPLPCCDLSALPAAAREREIAALARREARRPFDLERGPVARFLLLRLGAEEHRLLLLLHHIVSDDWSISLLLRELAALYRAAAKGEPSPLPGLGLQYADVSAWQRRWLAPEERDRQVAWWRERLAPPLPLLELPADRPRPAARSFRGARLRRRLPRALSEALAALGGRAEASPFMVLLAAYATLLGRCAATGDLMVGAPIANRHRREVEGLIGFLVNTLALRLDLAGEPSFLQLVGRCRELALEAYDHQDLPFDLLVEELWTERDPSRSPLCDAMLVFGNAPALPRELAPGLVLAAEELETGVAKVDLTLFLEPSEEGLGLIWEHSTDLFDRATIERMAERFATLLAGAVERPELPIADLPLLSAAERAEVAQWSAGTPPVTPGEGPAPLLHALFLAAARRAPQATALVVGRERWSYAELARRALRLAARLRALGVGPEVPVGILMERSAEMVIGMLGTLAAGGFYVPLDPKYPAERLRYLMEDSGCAVLLRRAGEEIRVPAPEGALELLLDEPLHDEVAPERVPSGVANRPGSAGVSPALTSLLAGETPALPGAADACGDSEELPSWRDLAFPGNLAYLIYTSGSTGLPKAVAIEHRSAAEIAFWARATFSAEELSGVLASTSIAFDISVFEIFAPLAWGGTVLLAQDALALPALPAAGEVRLVNTVPSAMAELLAAGRLPRGVRTVNLAGEALARQLVERAFAVPGVERVLNLYGPSEDTTYSTWAEMERGARAAPGEPSLGRPLDGTRAYVVDEWSGRDGRCGERCGEIAALSPMGIPGELLLGGGGLSRGYFGRPELTAERFVPDPFGVVPGARLYRTGDRVRRRDDGRLDYLGRIDHQVKIRGHRIEVGEVEAALRALPEVEAAAALAVAAESGGAVLAAAVVLRRVVWPASATDSAAASRAPEALVPVPEVPADAGATVRQLRAALRERLPEPLVPTVWKVLDRLPLNANGKVDRRALATLMDAAWDSTPAVAPGTAGFVPPRNPLEELIAGFFATLLGRSPVGMHDGFFDLGGHSLLAMRLLSLVTRACGVDLPLQAVFEAPTPEALARRVEEARAGAAGPPRLLERQPRDGELPLTPAQEQLWFLDRLMPGGAAYVLPFQLTWRGPLAVAALAAAVRGVVERHEVLRTIFPADDGRPRQQIAAAGAARLPLVDLSGHSATDAAVEADRLGRRAALEPFDLAAGPLWRARLLRLEAEEHRLFFCLHHIVADGWSLAPLMRDLAALYASCLGERGAAGSGGAGVVGGGGAANGAQKAGAGASLPALPIQPADYAACQRRWLAGELLTSEIAWWRRQLAGAPEHLDLPFDRPRPERRSFRGGVAWCDLDPAATAGIGALARRAAASPFMVLLAAFETLLLRSTHQEDFLVGSPIANRDRPEIQELVGLFVNTLVVRSDVAGDPPFVDLVARVRDRALAAYAHRELPLAELVAALAPGRDLAANPLIQVIFTHERVAPPPAAPASGVRLELAELPSPTAKFDLNLTVVEEGGAWRAAFQMSTDSFEPATMARWAARFAALVAAIAAAPERPLGALSLLPPAERAQIAGWSAGPPVDSLGEPLLHALFLAAARRTPQATALVAGRERWSYAALAHRALRLAERLRALGVGPEVAVGILAERSPEMVVAMLGTLLAGGYYVPLETKYPAERLAFMLADSGCAVLLRSATVDLALPLPESARELDLSAAVGEPEGHDDLSWREWALPENLAYLIYTSGSTGRPKAVAIEHRSAVALASWARRTFSREELAGVLASTSIAFDISVFEILLTLGLGGTVYLARSALELPELPAASEVRVVTTVPSLMAELLEVGALPPGVRAVGLGGETLAGTLVERVYAAPGVERVLNLYGPSEDTTFSTVAEVPRGAPGEPLIGPPVDGTRATVLGPRGELCPLGVPGELLLGGAGLARGYLGRPELTAERFAPDPFAAQPGARVYRTGDLVRLRDGGSLDYLGRIDHQVKIRGNRIELGEVEAALRQHPAIAAAAVVAIPALAATPSETGGLILAATLVRREDAPGPLAPVTAVELRAALRERLPEPMIPTAWRWVERLPLSPNGKVDRQALARADWQLAPAPRGAGFVAPRGPLEELLAGVFAELLERAPRSPISVHDSFFELGGHSLLALRLLARVQRACGADLPLEAIFEAPTVAALARRIERAGDAPAAEERPVVVPQPRDRDLPLSFAQEQLWFLDRLLPGGAAYTLPLQLVLRGPLSARALGLALEHLIARHEALRTVFPASEGEPRQRALAAGPVLLPCVDLSALPGPAASGEAGWLAVAAATAPFDLAAGPLWRALLLRLGVEEHRFVLSLHHIVADGWSIGPLVRDLAAFYAAALAGAERKAAFAGAESMAARSGAEAAAALADAEAGLPPLPIQPADYAAVQRRWLQGEMLEREIGWWRRELDGAPVSLALPADRQRAARRSFDGAVAWVDLGPRAAAAALAQRVAATPFMVLLAACEVFLLRITGQEDFLIGTPVANRDRPEIQELVGFFVNTVVARSDCAGAPTFADLVVRVRERALGIYAHRNLPFEKLVAALAPDRDLAASPLFQVMFSYDAAPPAPPELPSGLTLELVELSLPIAKFDLSLTVIEEGGALRAALELSTDLFDAVTAGRLLRRFAIVLAAATADPERGVADLPLLGEEERQQVVVEWSQGTPVLARAGTVEERFREWARRQPEAPAVELGGRRWSYAQLDRRAGEIAAALGRSGAAPEGVVAIFLPRSCELIAALLGTLRAGVAYLPLDPALPEERLAYMLADSGATLVVTEEALRARVPAGDWRLLPLDGLVGAGETPALPGERRRSADARDDGASLTFPAIDPCSLAYVLYTSGSTGRPKGVMVEHRSLAHHAAVMADFFALAPDDRVLQFASLSFDAAAEEIFPALGAGAAVVLIEDPRQLEPARFSSFCAAAGVTVLDLPSADWHEWVSELAAAGEAPPAALRWVMVGGDVAAPEKVAVWSRAAGAGTSWCNSYGPTETTITATVHTPSSPLPAGRSVLIGRPLAGCRVQVVDPQGAALPIGVAGELWIGGPGVARGYRGRPDLTAERFLPDPFVDDDGAGGRIYRTGDRVRWSPAGELEFLGRLDAQVKLRGFRIELGEIENVLLGAPGVAAAAVILAAAPSSEARLLAFVVPVSPAMFSEPAEEALREALRRHLLERLPEHMVPAAFRFLEALPLTASGKLDRRCLAELGAEEGEARGPFVAPRSAVEGEVAAIWCGVLGVERVGAFDDFWDLGGHSLLATRMLARLRHALGIDLALEELFRRPRLADFAARVEEVLLVEEAEGEAAADPLLVGT